MKEMGHFTRERSDVKGRRRLPLRANARVSSMSRKVRRSEKPESGRHWAGAFASLCGSGQREGALDHRRADTSPVNLAGVTPEFRVAERIYGASECPGTRSRR